ncbi:hypothetical protein B0H14DRAFT_3435783 [Mycena olivaceomarginata]|nr:hypothetical protein B0H14DRAFT_3435783 [Mycena olivaceomarginata]
MDSLAEYTAPATGREFFTGPVPDPQDWDSRYNTWNARHSAINASLSLCPTTRIYGTLNQKPTGDPDPLGFTEFAQHLNAYDRSGDLWAFPFAFVFSNIIRILIELFGGPVF